MLLKCRFTLLLHRVFRLGCSIQNYTRTHHEYSVFTVNQLQCSCFLLGFNIVSELCRYDTSSRFSEKESTLFWKQCLKTETEHVTMKLLPLFCENNRTIAKEGLSFTLNSNSTKTKPITCFAYRNKGYPKKSKRKS